MSNFCCQHCFTEKNIAQFISATGMSNGTCSYCEMENVKLIEPSKIFQFIEKIDFGLEVNEDGSNLFDILNLGFRFFENRVLSKESLFQDILVGSETLLEKNIRFLTQLI